MNYNRIVFPRQPRQTAFGEQAVSEYFPIAAWKFSYNLNPELVKFSTLNGGSVDLDDNSIRLQTGVDPNGYAQVETRAAINYQPGIGGLIRFTKTLTAGVLNSEQGMGYGDIDDGFFFGLKGTEFGIWKRKNGEDTFVPMSSFSEGVFDGFNYTLLNVYQIEFQWLGAGEIRFYIEDPSTGGFELVHRIKQANSETGTSITNPSLPVYAYVKNMGNTSNIILRSSSATGGVEGKRDNPSLRVIRAANHSVSNVGSTLIPIISLYNPSTYFTKVNRISAYPSFLSVASNGNVASTVQVQIYKNSTITTPVYTNIDIDVTPVQYDTTATTLSGGNFITQIALGGIDKSMFNLEDIDIVIYPGDTITIAAIASGNVSLTAGLTFGTEL